MLVLVLEVLGALVMGVFLLARGWERAVAGDGPIGTVVEAPPMDWTPTVWCAGFTLAVLIVAVGFLRSGHPYAGGVQLCVAAFALLVTLGIWNDAYDRAHPAPLPPCPTRAGVVCEPRLTENTGDPGRSGHQCRSGGDSQECADSGG
ncbi:DUF6234 family protein [Streptomyces sp. JV176]|uniref:DUF6234 family protein n=1 Tax=Streptomyces sp. JV176 TaxID=858630 RepID=UPI002E766165|nr:DUF6234 family protein [Streptomyces sp. JV176]MEE1800547.1 DUF6234 family protein [Streptomyces sp. JV176]